MGHTVALGPGLGPHSPTFPRTPHFKRGVNSPRFQTGQPFPKAPGPIGLAGAVSVSMLPPGGESGCGLPCSGKPGAGTPPAVLGELAQGVPGAVLALRRQKEQLVP